MELYYALVFFMFGSIFGSFYNVVGYRIPLGQSIVYPSSHCTKCNHQLGIAELIPIISFLALGGKCKNCGQKVSWFYPIFEFLTGICFSLSYIVFGYSIELVIALIFISMLIIVIISDYQTMIIPDEVLIFSGICLLITIFIQKGTIGTLYSLLDGAVAFTIMFLIKKIGDFIFKKESMGGGDIKLMFLFGLVLGWPNALIIIFLASFIGLPVSIIALAKTKSHIIPFGPFLAVAAGIILFTQFDIYSLLNIMIV